MKLVSKVHSVVLIGSFNPPIFQPVWFQSKGLLTEHELETSKLNGITTKFSDFEVDWGHVQILQNRLLIRIEDERRFEAARDFAVGTFEILSETPIIQLGINVEAVYEIESEREWDNLGYKLVPPDYWSKILNNPGLAQLQVREKKRGDGYLGHTAVLINPMNTIDDENERFGINIQVNDHYELDDDGSVVGADQILNILKQQWEASIKRSNEIMGYISTGKA